MPVAAAAPLIGAGIGGVGSILGGVKGSSAATRSAQIQADAARQMAGQIQTALGQVNPQVLAAADKARTDLLAAASGAGQDVTAAGGAANALLNPYIRAGQGAVTNLADLMAPGGQLTRPFNASMMAANDPGYAFRMSQAAKALQGSAAARGGALGGGTLSALQGQSQQLASNEYQNAFERYRQNQQDIYNRLSGLTATGLTAGTTAGANLLDAARIAGGWNVGAAQQGGQWGLGAAQDVAANTLSGYRSIADLITGGAAAQAGGVVGSANAWQNALGGVANAAGGLGGFYQQQNLLDWLRRNPGIFQAPSLTLGGSTTEQV